MKSFVQKVNGEFSNINFLTAAHGFYQYGYDVEFFKDSDTEKLIDDGQITKETPVFSGIPIMDIIFERLGCLRPIIPYYPQELSYDLGREVSKKTIREASINVLNNKKPCFIKPLEEKKKTFNGFVAKKLWISFGCLIFL